MARQADTELYDAVEHAVEASMQTPLRDPILEGLERTQGSGVSKTMALLGVGFVAGYLVARRGE